MKCRESIRFQLKPKDFVGKCIGYSTRDGQPLIEFTEFIDGHSGHGINTTKREGKRGCCWYIPPEYILKEATYKEAVLYSL